MRLTDLNTVNVPRGDLIAAALGVLGIDAKDAPIYQAVATDNLLRVLIPTDAGLVTAEHEYQRNDDARNAEARITSIVRWSDIGDPRVAVKAWWEVPRESTKSELLATLPGVADPIRVALADDLPDRAKAGDFVRECLRRRALALDGLPANA